MTLPTVAHPPVVLLEIGSNQVHIVVAQDRAPFTVLHDASATLRLGGQLTPDGELPLTAWQALQQQLHLWQPLWSSTPPSHRRVVCTQVLRDACNRTQWMQWLQALWNCEVHIIDGPQEAAWGYAAAMLDQLQPPQQACWVLDIGGRSTEVSRGQGSQWMHGLSLPIGAVSWSQRYFQTGCSPEAFAQALAAASQAFAALAHPQWQPTGKQVYGVAGVAQSLGQVLAQLGHPQDEIHAPTLRQLQMLLEQHGSAWLQAHCQLPAGLVPMLGGCISTMRALMQVLQLQQLHISPYGLRHAALHAFVQSLQPAPN